MDKKILMESAYKIVEKQISFIDKKSKIDNFCDENDFIKSAFYVLYNEFIGLKKELKSIDGLDFSGEYGFDKDENTIFVSIEDINELLNKY